MSKNSKTCYRSILSPGIVFNPTTDFNVSASNPATFIFVTEEGTIAAWNRNVDPTNAELMVDNFPSAVYKGVTIGRFMNQNLLYVANFRGGTVDVFDKNFSPFTLSAGAFTDPNLPGPHCTSNPTDQVQCFAPFNAQNIGGNIYVTFALQTLPSMMMSAVPAMDS